MIRRGGLTPSVDRGLAGLMSLEGLTDRGLIRLAKDGNHWLFGESALSHELHLSYEASYQNRVVRRKRLDQ